MIPIKIVLDNIKTTKIQEAKKSKYNIIIKKCCSDDLNYYGYDRNKSVYITYSYLFVLCKNVDHDYVKNNTKY